MKSTRLDVPLTGGCQCGAVRFSVTALGRASICYCRMCQKAFGGIGGALVAADEFAFTRGAPAHFKSSNKATRGFCSQCGTPLTFEAAGNTDFSIAAFDTPDALPPVIQLSPETRLKWTDGLTSLPVRGAEETAKVAGYYSGIQSFQHPDHDTVEWPAKNASAAP
jgi:hypothetical protein